MADERLNDLENARTMNNAGVVDTGDSERAQQENLVTQTAQAHYEETRAKRIAKQSVYTTLLGEYKVLEGKYDNSRAGKNCHFLLISKMIRPVWKRRWTVMRS